MRRRLSASALQTVLRSAMNFSRTGNRALDMDVSLIVAGGEAFCATRKPPEPLFVQRFAFDRAAAKEAGLVLGKVGAGVDRAAVVPNQGVAQLPDVLRHATAPFPHLV